MDKTKAGVARRVSDGGARVGGDGNCDRRSWSREGTLQLPEYLKNSGETKQRKKEVKPGDLFVAAEHVRASLHKQKKPNEQRRNSHRKWNYNPRGM